MESNRLAYLLNRGLIALVVFAIVASVAFVAGFSASIHLRVPNRVMFLSSGFVKAMGSSNDYVYAPDEPVVVLTVDSKYNVAKVLFVDGHTDSINMDWLDPIPYTFIAFPEK